MCATTPIANESNNRNNTRNLDNANTVSNHFNEASAAEIAELKATLQRSCLLHDRAGDLHYDTISALHKSIRGSDSDAALYWLARMVSVLVSTTLMLCMCGGVQANQPREYFSYTRTKYLILGYTQIGSLILKSHQGVGRRRPFVYRAASDCGRVGGLRLARGAAGHTTTATHMQTCSRFDCLHHAITSDGRCLLFCLPSGV